jgi:hypothetical protein
MKVGLITTLNTNIGDDLIRAGVMRLLEALLPSHLSLVVVNKHDPMTVYPPGSLGRTARLLPPSRFRRRAQNLTARLTDMLHSRFETCDLIVQCGAPVIYPGCSKGEWSAPLWYGVIRKVHQRIPVFNLAAGSAYSWEHCPETIPGGTDATYAQDIHSFSRLTTARDQLTEKLFASVGASAPLIPCTAFLASGPISPRPERTSGPIILNYMPGGGHYSFGEDIDASRWRRIFLELVKRLRKRHALVLLCHHVRELRAAEALGTGLPVRLADSSVSEYFSKVCDARLVISNRLHASVAIAGMGVPTMGIGTDTRMLMLDPLGLPYDYVEDVTAEALEEEAEAMLLSSPTERERLLQLREVVTTRYLEEMSSRLDI